MGFRLSSFLGGMAEGAIEIEENVRKRNQELIDTSLSLSAERTAKSVEERKKQQEVYDLLAKQLSSFDGMDDNKVNVVLSYGPEVAASFLSSAPAKAKREGLSVADYVVLLESGDGNLPQVPTQKLISSGRLPGMPAIQEPVRPDLAESPIFGRDYGEQYESTKSALFGGMGIEIPEIDEDVQVPQGRINFMDLLGGGEGGEGLSVTRSGLNKSIAERLVPMSDANIEIRDDGSLVYDREQQVVAAAINDIQTQTISMYNILASNDPVMAATNPERVYQIALESVIQDLPEDTAALFPRLNISSAPTAPTQSSNQPSTQPPATQSTAGASVNVRAQIDAIDNNAALTDAQKSAKKRAAIAAAGLAKTPQEADQILASGNY